MVTQSKSGRPRLAVEISAERVVTARANDSGDSVDIYTMRQLPTGCVTPNLTSTNVTEPAALSNALQDALQTVAGKHQDVVLVLPDAAVRITLLDFDSFPERREEALGILRVRLRKALPFDVDQAR